MWYSSFEGVSPDHRITAVKICSNPCRNMMQTIKSTHYDWPYYYRDINNKYMITLRNKFDALQDLSEILTPNDKYENFINVHMEAAAECIPTKHRVPWETLAVRKKWDNKKTSSLCNKRNPTDANTPELKKAQRELLRIPKRMNRIHSRSN